MMPIGNLHNRTNGIVNIVQEITGLSNEVTRRVREIVGLCNQVTRRVKEIEVDTYRDLEHLHKLNSEDRTRAGGDGQR
jgi:hypothetical protein